MKINVERLEREGWEMVGCHSGQYAAYKQRCNRKDHRVIRDLLTGYWMVYRAPKKG